MFDADKFTQIWLLVRDDYPSLSDRAVKVLLPSVTTYMCETGFSAVAVMRTKYQSWLITEKELQIPFHQ